MGISIENTIESKQIFFSQYWGQEVHRVKLSLSNPLCKVKKYVDSNLSEDYLELKHLSSISDIDAKDLVRFMGYGNLNSIEAKEVVNKILIDKSWNSFKQDIIDFSEISSAVDELRSMGYAYLWWGLSVEKQVEDGWIKLV